MNILKPEFYEHLIYNGPPCTRDERLLFGVLAAGVGLEFAICNAIEKYGSHLMQYIINPSEKVIITLILHDDSYDSNIIDTITNPTIEMKAAAIKNKPHQYCVRYIDDLSAEDIANIFKSYNSKKFGTPYYSIIQYIPEPSDEIKWHALNAGPDALKYIEKPTLEMCEFAIEKTSYLDEAILKKIKHHKPTQKIVDAIMKSYKCPIQYIPEEYYTEELVTTAIKKNGINLNHVPDKYINKKLCEIALQSNYASLQYIPEEYIDEQLCEMALQSSYASLQYIPNKYQTNEIRKRVISKHPSYLNYCAEIDNELMRLAFKSETGCRKDRMRYINWYSEADILRLVKLNPHIIRVLNENKKTDRVIRTALEINGYALEYVNNQTEEYQRIALLSQPNAKKYINEL